jgi:hypothetical protein
MYMSTIPLDVNDGFGGDVTLCLDVPEDVFDKYDVTDDLMKSSGYRLALIPADELNRLGKPQVYDHFYIDSSRRELLHAADIWENDGSVDSFQHANEMREAIAFFDQIGWLTPLRLREEPAGGRD